MKELTNLEEILSPIKWALQRRMGVQYKIQYEVKNKKEVIIRFKPK